MTQLQALEAKQAQAKQDLEALDTKFEELRTQKGKFMDWVKDAMKTAADKCKITINAWLDRAKDQYKCRAAQAKMEHAETAKCFKKEQKETKLSINAIFALLQDMSKGKAPEDTLAQNAPSTSETTQMVPTAEQRVGDNGKNVKTPNKATTLHATPTQTRVEIHNKDNVKIEDPNQDQETPAGVQDYNPMMPWVKQWICQHDKSNSQYKRHVDKGVDTLFAPKLEDKTRLEFQAWARICTAFTSVAHAHAAMKETQLPFQNHRALAVPAQSLGQTSKGGYDPRELPRHDRQQTHLGQPKLLASTGVLILAV